MDVIESRGLKRSDSFSTGERCKSLSLLKGTRGAEDVRLVRLGLAERWEELFEVGDFGVWSFRVLSLDVCDDRVRLDLLRVGR